MARIAPSLLARGLRPLKERPVFVLMTLWGGAMMWLCRQLPLLDLPQHAAQARLMQDLLAGSSPWGQLVKINLFTPYALEYLLASMLWFLPVNVAFTLILEAAYFGLILTFIAFRRALKGDPKLDFLFIPGFFGFTWQMGFVPFLLAAPLSILFILLARTQARAANWRTGLGLAGCGILLFFSHGLTFLFSLFVGALLTAEVAWERRCVRWRQVAPYLPLLALALVYQALARQDRPTAMDPSVIWGFAPVGRIVAFFVFPLGEGGDYKLFAGLTLALLLAPWLLGCRLNKSEFGWWAPFTAVVIVFFLAPGHAFNAYYIYPRFAIYILPAYALLFRPGREPSSGGRIRTPLAMAILAVGCGFYLGVRSMRLQGFSRETAQIDSLLRSLPPGKRVLGLMVDRESPAARQPDVYQHYLAWYQAYRHGFVDVNFAAYAAQVVRFRPEGRPAVPAGMESKPMRFQFREDQAWIYDFIIIKGRSPQAAVLAKRVTGDPDCRFDLLDTVEDWKVFGQRARTSN
jgi:hypothetical protein